ncbi:MAG: NAD(P)-dependent oxidoreductase [Endozoicomonadaceae bacterium]|nr:NAD(P)-dependent oxidoreductase [Endozoicomonadaceae bacterium]
MRVLIIGRTEHIGIELCQLFSRKKIPYIALYTHQFNLHDLSYFHQLLDSYQPTIIVNTTNVKSFNQIYLESELCFKLHQQAISILAKACEKKSIILLHISSWRVFNGENRTSYLETDEPTANDLLGKSFLDNETTIRQLCSKHLILRLSWVINWRGGNRLILYLNAMKSHKPVPVYLECYGSPISAAEAARVILALCEQLSCHISVWGVYHYSSEDIVSERFFVETIQAEAEKNDETCDWSLFYPVHDRYKTKHYACLDSTLITNTFGIQKRSWRYNLNELIAMAQCFLDKK